MKRTWIWMALAILLCGCGREAPAGTLPTQPEAPREAAPLQETPLGISGCIGLYPLGEDLLLLSPGAEGIILSRLSHETLATTALAEVALAFSGEVPGLQIWGSRVSWYDIQARQTVIPGRDRIDAPEGLTGVPLLSEDGKRLFYCTEADIRCLELDTGVSRVLKQDGSPGKTLQALLLGDTVLQCVYEDPTLGRRSLFLSTATGQTLHEGSGELRIRSSGERFYADLPEALVFGTPGTRPRTLLTGAQGALLPECGGAVTWDGAVLSLYDLETGRRTGALALTKKEPPRSFCSAGEGILWFLAYDEAQGCDVLFRWDTAATAVEDPAVCTAPYYTAEDPDLPGLEGCREEAGRISQRFGVRVLVWTDAVQTAPWDYDLTAEHRVEVLLRELKLLEERLARYPQGFLKTLAERAGGLDICLVRSISPSREDPGGLAVEGLQFWAEDRSCIALTIGENAERLLYHELCHIIDTQVFSASHAYDDWDSLNPGDFEYDYDYIRNRSRDGRIYLQETSRSFIDTYSMSFPREDRARIMEYAMTAGNAEVFAAPILQQKLTKLCAGIREAFGLKDYAAPLPWEQYLLRPLAPASRE